MKPITHMVFGGNALRTLCLCGILRYIYFYNLDAFIRDVSGTSMGAFFALAFALKIPIEQLEQMIYKVCKDKNIAQNYVQLNNIITFAHKYVQSYYEKKHQILAAENIHL